MPNCKIGDRAMITNQRNYGKQCIILKEENPLKWRVQILEPANAFRNKTMVRLSAGDEGIVYKNKVIPLADPDQHITDDVKELENV